MHTLPSALTALQATLTSPVQHQIPCHHLPASKHLQASVSPELHDHQRLARCPSLLLQLLLLLLLSILLLLLAAVVWGPLHHKQLRLQV